MNSAQLSFPADTSAQPAVIEGQPTWWSDYAALTKPRILLMILLTVGMGMIAAVHREISWAIAWHTLFGTALIAASASALNQWLEQDYDVLMPRTRSRPLPSGRLSSFEAASFGWLLGGVGFVYLAVFTNLSATLVGLVTWVSYVWIYTPLKLRSWWNTAVGTLPGALPVLIGWTAAGGSVFSWEGWLLTSVVILWQFPHFMSIAWLYKDQYDLAGYRMITNEEPTGWVAGWHAVIPAALLIPVSWWAASPSNGLTSILTILALGVCCYQTMAAFRFLADRNTQTARKLLRSSLLYLPIMMMVIVIRSCL